MHNVVVSIKSRRVAITDDGFFSSCNETESDYGYLLTEDEKSQLELALKIDSSESVPENGISDGFIAHRHSVYLVDGENRKPSPRHNQLELALKIDSSESVPENGISDGFIAHRHSVYLVDGENRKPSPRHKKICFLLEVHFVWRRRSVISLGIRLPETDLVGTQYILLRRGMNSVEEGILLPPRSSLCVEEKTEDLLPLLDFLANKVKAIRHLRELHTTNLPPGTFPVKVAIPVVPTIRVLVTFLKFEELHHWMSSLASFKYFRSARNESPKPMMQPRVHRGLDKSPYELLKFVQFGSLNL
ncbi:hypothetical protein IFM89_014149 [Coptis chinensis]|uniref:Ankyrin repeat domain-containing protein n=1 Tax=Coptis chinensis TaxID=261450 RepID=A0A835HXK7_9MAGN|nr:hypothetical protein IFM89_014149 [Coptis chinensis]